MKKIEIKEMNKEQRRNFLLYKLQINANFVLWSIRDNEPDIMIDIKNYRQYYKLYRNIKQMEGEEIYDSPRVDLHMQCMNWESY